MSSCVVIVVNDDHGRNNIVTLREIKLVTLPFSLLLVILISGIKASAFHGGPLAPLAQDSDNSGLPDQYEQVIEQGIFFLRDNQSPNEPQPEDWPGDLHRGEFATYK
jgi:hypothetical protein